MAKTASSLALIAAALAIGGCGGGSSSAGTGQPPSASLSMGRTSTSGDARASHTPSGTSQTPSKDPGRHPASNREQAGRTLLVAKADAICGRLNAELAADKPANKSVREIARVTPAHAAAELQSVDELSKLTPPAALAGAWRQIVSDRRTLAEELLALDRDAKAHDQAAIQALAVSKRHVHTQLSEVAKRAGFTDCSEVG